MSKRKHPTVGGKPVTMGELRGFVIRRDRRCFAVDDPGHYCIGGLTLEHVTKVHGPDDPRRDDERHCGVLCLGLNGIGLASRELRERMRDHLRDLYPHCGE